MLNYLWLGLVLLAVTFAGLTGRMKELTEGAFTMTETAVMKIALPLIGFMALWLGIMRLAEKAGLITLLARALRPIMVRLFPDVPADHPAMGSMLMNMAANMLGLSNAATPLGLRAMRDLETLNPRPGTATNAMCTFLAINTSSIQILPATAIGLLTVAKSVNATAIVAPALIATTCSTIVGLFVVKWLEKWKMFRLPDAPAPVPAAAMPTADAAPSEPEPPVAILIEPPKLRPWAKGTLAFFFLSFALLFVWPVFFPESYQGTIAGIRAALFPKDPAFSLAPEFLQRGYFIRSMETLSLLAVPFLLAFFPLYAALTGVKVYEEFVEGAKEGFQVGIKIIPFLVAILAAIGMFRGAGGIEMLQRLLSPILTPLGFPPDLLPMVLVRPLSGSATTGLFTELIQRLGPDDIVTRMGATIFGSTETTFYVLAVYFGSVAVRRTRHALAAGLAADATGVVASVAICRLMFG